MNDAALPAPLLALSGERPAAPEWFTAALANAPARSFVEVQGIPIELLTWGERGKPGILFLHGNAAHAEWWSFIAPLFTPAYRVAAISWSGMGASGWRDAYAPELFAEEVFAAAEAAGLFSSAIKPVVIAHSFGGVPAVRAAAQAGERLRAVVVIDTPLLSPEMRKAREAKRPPPRTPKPHNVYRTLDDALRRFRFLPPQGCQNLFIADHIARVSLKRAARAGEGDDGWTWRFDPFLWRKYRRGDPAADLASAKCPVAIMWGERSQLFDENIIAFIRSVAPARSPMIAIPEAEHHVMVDQPLALVAALRTLLAAWPSG
jgi:pimeloyl-ACP methyl ester carboxylesterase